MEQLSLPHRDPRGEQAEVQTQCVQVSAWTTRFSPCHSHRLGFLCGAEEHGGGPHEAPGEAGVEIHHGAVHL